MRKLKREFLNAIWYSLTLWALILIFLVGCASNPYQTNHSTPYMQFSHEGKKPVTRSPRAIYFDNKRKAVDNMVPLGICVA